MWSKHVSVFKIHVDVCQVSVNICPVSGNICQMSICREWLKYLECVVCIQKILDMICGEIESKLSHIVSTFQLCCGQRSAKVSVLILFTRYRKVPVSKNPKLQSLESLCFIIFENSQSRKVSISNKQTVLSLKKVSVLTISIE